MSQPILVDCRGMQCPAPILEIAKTARRVAPEPALLEILADDDDFPTDLEAWCRSAQAELRGIDQESGWHRAVVALNGGAAATGRTSPPRRATTGGHRRRTTGSRPATTASMARPPTSSSGTLDLLGLRAPYPVVRLSEALIQRPGQAVVVRADDPGFLTDVVVWANSSRVKVLSLEQKPEGVIARLEFPRRDPEPEVQDLIEATGASVRPSLAHAPPATSAMMPRIEAPTEAATAAPDPNRCTLLVLRNDFESLMAAMLTANAAKAQGMDAVIFFSFWGVNLLRGERPRKDLPKEKVSFLQRLMKWMMPRGPKRQKMSKMHMAGAGRGLMQHFMRRNNVLTLPDLIEQAVDTEVRFMVCTMSMGIMGIQKRDLMDLPNLEFGGVTSFVEQARDSRMSLVF